MELLASISSFINDPQLLCFTMLIGLLFKAYLLTILLSKYVSKPQSSLNGIVLLCIILFSTSMADLYWIITLLHRLDVFHVSDSIHYSLSRIIDALNTILHLSMSLFIGTLLHGRLNSNSIYKKLRFFSGAFLTIFFLITIFFEKHQAFPYVLIALRSLYFYILIIGVQTIYEAIKAINTKKIPNLLRHQLKIFIYAIFAPFLLFKLLTVNPFTFSPNYVVTTYGFINVTNVLLTCASYFCAKKLIRLRFLNVKDHVETVYNLNFVKDFKKTLGDLSHVSNVNELRHITIQFFRNIFEIPQEKVHFFIRNIDGSEQPDDQKQLAIERFLSVAGAEQQILIDFLYTSKIAIRDEIEFSAFYEQQDGYQEINNFLYAINGDLFLPIYDKKKLIAYIVIDHNARPQRFYNNVERDEMLVFAAYISSIINLIRNRNFDALLAQEKDLKEELYLKHQEINQYKESIRSFFRNSHDRKVGIVFFKNRRFIFGNQTAQELLQCDPTVQRGHPVTLLLKKLIKNVQSYQSAQTAYHHHSSGKKIIITALPHMESNDIIFTIYHPDINDTIKMQADLLKDPSHWDYLLYLETTESGQLINQLVPGTGEKLLNFKIDLLKIGLNKKATLLCLPEEDLEQTVDLIHAISLRKELHTLQLTEPEQEYGYAIKLFGINPLLVGGTKAEPLLEKLDRSGTLFIHNVHFLSLETQEALVDFIRYGAFNVFKSEHRIISDVRIMCSSVHDVGALAEKGLFSYNLFRELKKTSLNMPSLTALSENEFNELTDNVLQQAIKTKPLESMLTLSEKERAKLHTKCPKSLQELRKKIYGLLLNKSQKHEVEESIEISPAVLSSDPELTTIINLGKDALKDRTMMEYLWRACDKNQTKIASLLGVNRSSVNRRCKDYHLM